MAVDFFVFQSSQNINIFVELLLLYNTPPNNVHVFLLQTGLSQNMATILAMATMKEKLNSNNAAGAEIKPSVTITPSRLSPSLSSENGNSMNSSKCKSIHQIFTTA